MGILASISTAAQGASGVTVPGGVQGPWRCGTEGHGPTSGNGTPPSRETHVRGQATLWEHGGRPGGFAPPSSCRQGTRSLLWLRGS